MRLRVVFKPATDDKTVRLAAGILETSGASIELDAGEKVIKVVTVSIREDNKVSSFLSHIESYIQKIEHLNP